MALLYHEEKNGAGPVQGNLALLAKITGSVILRPGNPTSEHLSYSYICTHSK